MEKIPQAANGHNGTVIAFPSADAEQLVRIAPGTYSGVYHRHRTVWIFRAPKLLVEFTVLEHPGITLARWYRVTDNRGGRVRAGRNSDLVRELSALLGERVRIDRVPVSRFQGIALRLEVRDVLVDAHQRELAPINRYSAIAAVLPS